LPGRAAELLSLDAAGRAFSMVALFDRRRRAELLVDPPGGGGESHVRAAFAAASGGPLDRILGAELRTYLPGDLLVKMDIATMAHGLEARSPLLDHTLVEWACRLPEEWKLDTDGRGKALLKDAFQRDFPPGFLDRPKRGLGVPLQRWIRGDLAGFFARELGSGALARSGLVRAGVVAKLLAEQRAGVAAHQHRIFALVALSIFLGGRRGT
jgi:asparagine synthase (glutamine-hydrolysing)